MNAAALGQGSNMDLSDTTIALERTRLAIARELAGSGPPVPMLAAGAPDGVWTAVRETEVTLGLWQALRVESDREAAELIDVLERESEARGRGPALCTALFARTLLPDVPDRWDAIAAALRMAATRGYVRPLLDGGEPVRTVLRAAIARALSPSVRAHARLLLERFDGSAPAGQRWMSDAPAEALLTPLTEREREVLACLVRGQSNKDIAQSMFVSVDIAKTHLKRIYAKLGVSGRGQAVSRARELGLDPPIDA